MSESQKKVFKKIDIEQLKTQQQAAQADVDRTLKDLAEDIERKKKIKM